MASGGGGDHIIEIIIETSDRTGGALNGLRDRLLAFDRQVQQTQQRIRQLTNRGHRITLDLIDRVTPAGSEINRTLRRLADRAWSIPLRLNDSTASGIREVEARLFRLTGRAYNVAVGIKENASEKLKDFGSGIGGAGAELLGMAGMGLGIADTVNTYKDFEAEMSRVGAISGASADELDQLTGAAMEMGAQSQYGATDAAKALEYMAMAGWKTEQMIAGLPGVIGLAEASGEDLAMVSDVVTDALTAFGLQASDAAHFADVLAATASNANTDIGKLGYTFKYVAPLAGALKYSIEDVSLAAGLMANAGIKGEQAGTSLRNIMTNLVDPSKEAATALESVGLSADFIRNADGTVKPFRQTLMDLRTAFSGLTDAQKAEAASAIAGAEGMSGFLAMVNAAEKDVGNLATVLDNAEGSTQRMSDAMQDNLAGDLENLGGAFETFQLNLMKGTPTNFLREFVQGVTEDIDKLNEYMADGLDFSDIGKVAMDVITQLKNKFLELDGVGSVLAGGALIGGIGLITSKALKLIDVLKGAANPEGGAGGGSDGFGGGHGQSVGVMNVKANVVNLSGPHGPGGGGPIPPGGGGNGGGNPPPPGGGAGRFARMAKGIGIVGTVLSIGSAAYDVYSTGKYNEKMNEEVDWGIQTAQKRWSDTNDAAWEANEAYKRGEISLEERDKAYANWAKAEADFNDATDYQERVEKQNETRENAATGGAVGSVAGAVLGGALGSVAGPVGIALGSMVGSMIGSQVGEIVGANWESIKAEASNTAEWAGNQFDEMGQSVRKGFEFIGAAAQNEWDYLKNSASEASQNVGKSFDDMGSYLDSNVWSPIKDAAQNEWDYLKNTANDAAESFGKAWDNTTSYIDQNFLTPLKDAGITATNFTVGAVAILGDEISKALSPAASYIEEQLWTPLKESAQNELDYISTTASEKAEELSNAFSEAGTYLDEELWTPLKETAQNEWDYITNTAAEKAAELSEAYSDVVTSFDEEVWTPLKEGAAEKWAEISELPGQAATYMSELWTGVSDWFSEAVWTPLGDTASAAWSTITETAGSAWDSIVSYFEPAAAWFDSTVWQPISSAVGSVQVAISSAFEAAWSAVTGIWAQAGAWFESNVIAPIKEKFSAITSLGASITGLSTSGGGGEHKAYGGFVTSPRTILAGEDGGEVIIPLSKNKRSRALGLFERTAEILNVHSVNTGANTDISTGYQAEAFGGFVTSPRRILAGEDGGEVIIPLGSNMRKHAIQLFGKTAEILNVPHAGTVAQADHYGGFANPSGEIASVQNSISNIVTQSRNNSRNYTQTLRERIAEIVQYVRGGDSPAVHAVPDYGRELSQPESISSTENVINRTALQSVSSKQSIVTRLFERIGGKLKTGGGNERSRTVTDSPFAFADEAVSQAAPSTAIHGSGADALLDSGQKAVGYTAATAQERSWQNAPTEEPLQEFAGISVPDYNMIDVDSNDFAVKHPERALLQSYAHEGSLNADAVLANGQKAVGYTAATSTDGSWQYMPMEDLPQDFAGITGLPCRITT